MFFLHFSNFCYSIHFLIFFLILMQCVCLLSSCRFGTLQTVLFIYVKYTRIEIRVLSIESHCQNHKIYLLNTIDINFVGEKITKCINKSTIHLHRKFDLVPTNVRSVEQFIVIV